MDDLGDEIALFDFFRCKCGGIAGFGGVGSDSIGFSSVVVGIVVDGITANNRKRKTFSISIYIHHIFMENTIP